MRGHLEETLRRIVAEAIANEVQDPRVGMVTVSEVRLNRDSSVAEVFVTVYDDDVNERKKAMKALKKASGFLRSRVGEEIRMRHVPQIRFRYDESLDRSFRIEALLGTVGKRPSEDEPTGGEEE